MNKHCQHKFNICSDIWQAFRNEISFPIANEFAKILTALVEEILPIKIQTNCFFKYWNIFYQYKAQSQQWSKNIEEAFETCMFETFTMKLHYNST